MLNKGDTIERVSLVDILGKRPEGRFRLAVLALAQQIEEECLCTCKTEHSSTTGEVLRLRLLTDSEAAKYNPQLCDRHLKGFRRRLKLATRVDITNLTDHERLRLQEQIILKSRQYQAIRAAKRRVITEGGHSLPE
jgi:hypothetical protein